MVLSEINTIVQGVIERQTGKTIVNSEINTMIVQVVVKRQTGKDDLAKIFF
jgi:hypothetical protein